MNNKNARLLPWLLAVAMSIFALPAIAADEDGDGISDAVENSVGLDPSVAQGGMMMIQADGAFTRDRPTMVMDSAGNYHIAYAITDEGIEIDSSMPANTMQVAYMMLDADGNVLIDETQLLDTGLSLRVNTHLAVTSADTVVLVYTDRSAKDLYYIHIDPSADDQNGDAATPATIKAVSETMIDAGTWANLQVAVDSSNIIHAWGQDGQYMSFETDTTVVTASTNPWATASPNKNGHGNSVMALDGDGNVHVVFQDCTLNNCGVSYGMLDGADGSVLIEGTPLYNAGDLIDEPHASQYNLMIDSTGLVNIVWRDKRGTVDATSYCDYCGSGGITWFARIDPSLDDQDGSVADMSVIKVVDDVEIGTLLYFSAFMDANDTIHLFEHSHNGLDHMAIN
ncbi:MAG: hypothetical protein R3217_06395, partial [Gammaproteobacteria bacterium]|nr:hypothetical protein [Gammaproteobacteria bacterium]